MTAPGQAIAAVSTGDVSLAHYEIAPRKTFHVTTYSLNSADKLVADRHRYRNRFLRPRIPVIDMHVSPADRSLQHTNEHVVAGGLWNRNFLEPETRLGFGFHHGFHRLHHSNLGEAAKRGKIFASGDASSLRIKGHAVGLIVRPPGWCSPIVLCAS